MIISKHNNDFSKTKFSAQHHKKNNPFRKFLATALYNDGFV